MSDHSKVAALLITALLLLTPAGALGGERDLWKLWQIHLDKVDDHVAVVKACRNYAAAYPTDPFLPVVRSLEAWHLLSANKTSDAIRLLAPQLKAENGSLELGARRLARGWVTRLQRERVVEALQHYYRKEVRYPADLKELAAYPGLPGADKLPLADAWGKPWRYRLAGFEGVPGFRDQKYKLESTSAQPPWEAPEALTLPYAQQIDVNVSPTPGGASTVKVEFLDEANRGKTAVGQVGGSVEDLTLAYAGKGLVILCDTLHWKVVTWKK